MDYNATTQALALCIAENVPVVLWGKPGQGKALDVRTPIPTPTGWKTMEELQVGDQVFDERGNPVNVTAVYPQPKGRQCYTVNFDDGSSIIADAEHLWEVEKNSNYHVLSTEKIAKSIKYSKGKTKYRIPLCRPLYFPRKETNIPSYDMGRLVASSDSINERNLDMYLFTSVEQRKALLQGILDVAGDVDDSGYVVMQTRDEKISELVHEVVCSLGYKASVKEGEDGYTVSFLTKDAVFSSADKMEKLPWAVDPNEGFRYIVSVVPHESVDVKCITVDSESHLFLAGKSMIPTHNTSVIQNICTVYGIHLETVIASIREPSDFAGLPYFENGMTRLAAPSWVHTITSAASGELDGTKRIPMVFYDEISTAPPATQAALLRPILEGVVGETRLPKSTRTVAAANPPGIAADGWDFSPPAANRFTHLDWELDASTVKEGFTVGWPHVLIPALPKASVKKKYVNHAKALVGTFLGRNPRLVDVLPENFSGMASRGVDFKASSYAFPSPRSWEVAARLYAAWLSARFPDGTAPKKSVIHLLLTGTVGVSAAKEFLSFAEALDLPDPAELLSNPASYEVPERGDQLDVVMSSLHSYYLSRPTPQNWTAWGDILAATVEAGKGDIAYSYMNRWNALRPEGVIPTQRQSDSLKKILSELSPGR